MYLFYKMHHTTQGSAIMHKSISIRIRLYLYSKVLFHKIQLNLELKVPFSLSLNEITLPELKVLQYIVNINPDTTLSIFFSMYRSDTTSSLYSFTRYNSNLSCSLHEDILLSHRNQSRVYSN